MPDSAPTPARVPVETPTRALSGTTSAYVVGTGDGLLVDPAARAADLTETVEERGVEHVAVTHHHPDHVGAVADYADEYGLTVWARTGRAEAFERATGVVPDRTLGPGETGPGGVTVVDTPGHAPEHLAFATDTGLLCGDLAVTTGSVVVGAPEGDMRAYLSSLRRVYARNPGRLLPAHGPVIDDPRGTCVRLIEHRLDRERRIADAVEVGHETPEALVDAVYDKDVSDVAALARATVVAHLEKLAVEGRVDWDGQRATPP